MLNYLITRSYNTLLISKYRTELMGLATIMILLCHAKPNGVILPDIILKLMGLGQYGVNIFFFLSGFGIYRSLQNHSSLVLWYRKRFLRLFVPYLLITIPILILSNEKYSFINIVSRITTIGYWFGVENVSWFIAAIIPFYLLSPILKNLLDNITKYRFIILVVLWIGSSLICSHLFYYEDSLTIKHFIQTLLSFPSFILGMWISPYIRENGILFSGLIKTIILFVFLFFLEYSLTGVKSYWLVILLCLWFICSIIKFLPQICNLLTFLGNISLESYLLNTSLPLIFKGNGNLYYLTIIIGGVVFSALINKLSNLLISKMQ